MGPALAHADRASGDTGPILPGRRGQRHDGRPTRRGLARRLSVEADRAQGRGEQPQHLVGDAPPVVGARHGQDAGHHADREQEVVHRRNRCRTLVGVARDDRGDHGAEATLEREQRVVVEQPAGHLAEADRVDRL